MELHLVFLESEVLVTNRKYASWREIQDDFETYKASFGPWSENEVIDWLATEYSDISPAAAEQIVAFVASGQSSVRLTFQNE